jgi:hypothetical protein
VQQYALVPALFARSLDLRSTLVQRQVYDRAFVVFAELDLGIHQLGKEFRRTTTECSCSPSLQSCRVREDETL